MTPKFTLKTPILFLVFNRLDTTKRVFEEIRKVKPTKFYIASDGPRTKEEKKKTDAVRDYILKNIDWKCKVKTLFRKKNLGCKYAVSGALDWFFKKEEQGIILEDDCLPNQSFFRFCQELLEEYKDDNRIMSITGFNPLSKFSIKESYLFSKYFHCWGWATWRISWKKMDLEMEKYQRVKKEGKLKIYYPNIVERILREKRVKDALNKKVTAWDIPWSVSHQLNNALAIIPKFNLVENIGFSNQNSTHTKENYWDEKFLHYKSNKLNFPLKHPSKVEMNKKFFNKYLFHQIKRIIFKRLII